MCPPLSLLLMILRRLASHHRQPCLILPCLVYCSLPLPDLSSALLPLLNRLPDDLNECRDILNEMPTEAERSSAVEVIPVGLGRCFHSPHTHTTHTPRYDTIRYDATVQRDAATAMCAAMMSERGIDVALRRLSQTGGARRHVTRRELPHRAVLHCTAVQCFALLCSALLCSACLSSQLQHLYFLPCPLLHFLTLSPLPSPPPLASSLREAVLRTSLGDIHIKLFPSECPRTIENFSVRHQCRAAQSRAEQNRTGHAS